MKESFIMFCIGIAFFILYKMTDDSAHMIVSNIWFVGAMLRRKT
jgi:hypothetical protein